MTSWLPAFLLTELIEAPVYLFAGRRLPARRRWALALGASAVTHPILWWLFPENPDFYLVAVIVGESLVILTEGMLARLARLPRPWFWAAVANVASILCGLLVSWLQDG